MRCLGMLLFSAVSLASAASKARGDSSIQCEGGIVSVGDLKLDLLAKCGKPALVDERVDERWHGPGQDAAVTVEEWTYNFGPQSFVHLATLENGRVVRVERDGYGHAR